MSSTSSSKESFQEGSFFVRKKIKVYAAFVILSFLVVVMRAWYLQILKGEDFLGKSEQNRIRKISLPDYRGVIKDRRGKIIVNV